MQAQTASSRTQGGLFDMGRGWDALIESGPGRDLIGRRCPNRCPTPRGKPT